MNNPEGYVLVQVKQLAQWREWANNVAAWSTKADRSSEVARLKASISSAMISATQPTASPEQAEAPAIECDCETATSPDGARSTRCGSDQMRRAVSEGHAFVKAATKREIHSNRAAYLAGYEDALQAAGISVLVGDHHTPAALATQPTASNAGEREALELAIRAEKDAADRDTPYGCRDTLEKCAKALRAALATKPPAGEQKPVAVPSICDGKEQDEFETWAKSERYDMSLHTLHWLFLNEKTYAARQGWKGALAYVGRAVAQPEQVAQDREDAENYRWLRDHFEDVYAVSKDGELVAVKSYGNRDGDRLDDAIRAARARGEGEWS